MGRSRKRKGRPPARPRQAAKASQTKPGKRLGGARIALPLSALALAFAVWWSWPSSSAEATDGVLRLKKVEVLRDFPHDPRAFTQGLLWHDGKLYESTGQYGESSLRRLDPRNGEIEFRSSLAESYFGEGLARVARNLILLTWQSQVAFSYDIESLELNRSYTYSGEGWGLCNDGSRLIMSDGSHRLAFRDLETFEQVGSLPVTLRGAPLEYLNELEWAHKSVYANVWERDFIVRINVESGRVIELIDASGLISAEENRRADVLNGIAYDPEKDTFYITGKLWPRMFEVRFVDR